MAGIIVLLVILTVASDGSWLLPGSTTVMAVLIYFSMPAGGRPTS